MHIKRYVTSDRRNGFVCIYNNLLHLNYNFVIKCSHGLFHPCSKRNIRRIIPREPENRKVWNSYTSISNIGQVLQSDPLELEAQVWRCFGVEYCNNFTQDWKRAEECRSHRCCKYIFSIYSMRFWIYNFHLCWFISDPNIVQLQLNASAYIRHWYSCLILQILILFLLMIYFSIKRYMHSSDGSLRDRPIYT
jgi:hypothetical protein